MATAPEPGTVEQELAAMRRICGALDPLDEPSRRRVLFFVIDRYKPGRMPAGISGPALSNEVPPWPPEPASPDRNQPPPSPG
jgi:hypothetical protein